ncbi:hypothetical protein [uncultured Campylobacter sp.]|uniref:hypothetical protein n=1 Tax=uncultured Campylobacter sp. TaxID=218934 RepID=UPI002618A78B|nr:hypothetical protein [uncultured Campylobacter sp.]
MKTNLSKSGLPTLGVGGGAATNTAEFRVILNSEKGLKKPIFIARRGQLSCSSAQAIIALQKGDYIVDVRFKRDASREAWESGEIRISAKRVIAVTKGVDEIEVEPAVISYDDIPEKCWEGGNIYHNRDGGYFAEVE